MTNTFNFLDNRSNLRETWLNHDNLGISENEKNPFTTAADVKSNFSSRQNEFVDWKKSMVTSGSFIIETSNESGNCKYRNTENFDNQTSGNSMIKIEITPDLPCNLETECELRSNVSDSIFDKRKKNHIELGETNASLDFYRCTHCEKEYKTKRSIVRHFKLKNCAGKLRGNEGDENVVKTKKRGPRIVRLADNRYQCRHCNKTYTQKNNLFRHMREDHVKLAKPTSCNVCGKEFYNYRKLHQHLRCHSEKPYECSICCKRFSQVAHVQSHMFTHTGEKPYQCHICDKRFSKAFNLKIHIIRHNGEKQFKCRICQTEFFTHGELEKHVRIHTAERPYSCDTCGKRFKQNGHLKKHLLSHTGQKPYKCTMCKKDYVNSSHLKRHILSHTGEKLPEHLCPICGNNFSQPSTVKRHIAKVHRKFSHV